MNAFPAFPLRPHRLLLAHDAGAQLVEFAVALPLLVLFVVGIFDFSGAYTLKQRLTNLARDSARVAARDPSNDLGGTSSSNATGIPVSVLDAFQTVDQYMIGTNLSDCGVKAASTSGLTWFYNSPNATSNGCPAPGLVITINRGYTFPITGASPPTVSCQSQPVASQTAIVGTCVSIQYAYAWKFGRVANLMGRTMILPPQISAVAVALNEN